MQWYYAENDQQRGPVSAEEFQQLVAQGRIHDRSLVWRAGLAKWSPLQEVADAPRHGLAMPTPEQLIPPAAEGIEGAEPCLVCHRPFGLQHLIPVEKGKICINCRPIYIQRLREGLPTNPKAFEYASFWQRLAASIIDWLVISPITISLFLLRFAETGGGLLLVISMLIQFAAEMLYSALMHSSKHQATVGKLTMGIRVICPDGRDVSFARAVGRYFATVLSTWTLYIGYLLYFTDPEERRTLHDRIAGTRVIRKP